jgi:hypothetical protein
MNSCEPTAPEGATGSEATASQYVRPAAGSGRWDWASSSVRRTTTPRRSGRTQPLAPRTDPRFYGPLSPPFP